MGEFATRTFRIAKSTDEQLLKHFHSLRKEGPLIFHRVEVFFDYRHSPITYTLEKLGTDAELKLVLEKHSSLVKSATFFFDQGASVQFTRTEDRFSNSINVNPGNIVSAEGFLAFIDAARKHFGELDVTKGLTELLDADTKKHFEAREAALHNLEEIGSGFFERIQDLTQTQTKEVEELRNRLLKESESRRAEIETELKTGREQLAADKAALEAKKKEIDDREARHVRRYLRDQMKKLFTERAERFQLTANTRGLRGPVALLFTLLVVFFIGGAVYFGVLAEKSYDLSHVLRSVGFVVAFAVTTGFYIKWHNRWFSDHAKEEFRLKRQEVDVDRASWVVELAMEWKQEKGSEIPEYLVDRLSKNLFDFEEKPDATLTAADALASAMLGSAAGLKLKVGKNELEFDRKGLNNLKK